MPADALLRSVRARDVGALRRLLGRQRGAPPARLLVEAGRLAWKAGLAVMARHGGDLNASYRHYRPLHALIQEKPHGPGRSTRSRVACLEWLLAHGADPELIAAWPSMRALVAAAFAGERPYVDALIAGGARQDVFTLAALGRARPVATILRQQPSTAQARDGGGLTALHCCAGSRLGRHDRRAAAGLLATAARLLDAGADANAGVRSWGHDVDVMYFAVSAGNSAMARALLDAGADPTAALPPAIWNADYTLCDELLRRGARVDAASDGGRPILNELIRWGQIQPALWLLERGASPNVADSRGWTAVHQAASRGNERLLTALLAAGGDPSQRAADGVTPEGIRQRRVRASAARGARAPSARARRRAASG